jgi:succinyl-diaminopimelate desuccinylase
VQEKALTERLITYDTSTLEGLQSAAGFVKGWLEARDVEVEDSVHNGLPVIIATVGAAEGPTIVLHAHLDVVPGLPEQFAPRVDGDRLYGRGAYDMKGGLAAMLCATRDLASQKHVRVHFVCVSDEESDEPDGNRGSDHLVERGYTGDFAITGEPTDLRIGVQAKGVLALRVEAHGTSAHGSTPWLGDNAIVKAVDAFKRIEALPFARQSSELFDRPSISLGRIVGGDAINKVPDRCALDLDVRYLPGQDPRAILSEIEEIPDVSATVLLHRDPVLVAHDNPHVVALAGAVAELAPSEKLSVGRDGASDVISFIQAGVPAVEFGPIGGGHHGPGEWVSIRSLEQHRRALVDFVLSIPSTVGKGRLRIA